MRRVKGLKDIRTYSTLARQGRLASVARNWHRGSGGLSEALSSWDESVDRMIFKGKRSARRPSRNLFQDILEEQFSAMQIERVKECIAEMERFVADEEEISGALAELQRLREKLSQLEKHYHPYR